MSDLFRKASMRVAGRVYVAAYEAGNTSAATHAWNRLCALILSRPRAEVVVMEQKMGVRR